MNSLRLICVCSHSTKWNDGMYEIETTIRFYCRWFVLALAHLYGFEATKCAHAYSSTIHNTTVSEPNVSHIMRQSAMLKCEFWGNRHTLTFAHKSTYLSHNHNQCSIYWSIRQRHKHTQCAHITLSNQPKIALTTSACFWQSDDWGNWIIVLL